MTTTLGCKKGSHAQQRRLRLTPARPARRAAVLGHLPAVIVCLATILCALLFKARYDII